VGKVQKFYRDGDFACQLSLYLNYNRQRRIGAKSFRNSFILKYLAQHYVTLAEKQSGLMLFKDAVFITEFFNVEFYDRVNNCVKTETIWEEAIVAYFRALHWKSPEVTEKK
jgi:hypothetical protein